MKLYIAEDYNGMCKKGAELFFAQLTLKPDSVLGLATGSTPCGIYDRLAAFHAQEALDFSFATSVNLDEYVGLSPENDQSYRFFMEKNLFSRVNIKPGRTHLPNGLAADPDAECRRFDALIESLGGVDMQLLGIGLNGHIGFNEPADRFPQNTNCVNLTQSTIDANARFFQSADEVPKKAITMGIGTIMRARQIVLAISGENKKEIAKAALYGPITPGVPASVLQLHPNVTVILDTAAAALL